MRLKHGVFLAILLILSSNVWADAKPSEGIQEPSPNLSPAAVIRIVIEALRDNKAELDDDGIATVWRFAAPSNKAITGPADRFAHMIKNGFSEMLNHVDSNYGPLEIDNDRAAQPVWLLTPQGEEVGYLFHLRRQGDGEYEGMWMTEAVYPIPPRSSDTSI